MCPLLTRVLSLRAAACRIKHWDTSAARCIFSGCFQEPSESPACSADLSVWWAMRSSVFAILIFIIMMIPGCFRFFSCLLGNYFLESLYFSLLDVFLTVKFLRCSGYESFVKFQIFYPICGSLSLLSLMVS